MSTLAVGEIYPGANVAMSQAPLETAAAGGPGPTSGKLSLTAWAAFVVALLVIRMLWEYSA